ncbi:MAG: biopolymer transporter ExbD [Ignavibacteria bacterium]
MAGGGGLEAPEVSGGKGSKKYLKKGRGVHIDMTPMVDVIMLLLTFFMLTTTLSAPQLMKVSLPKGDVKDKVKVDMGNVLYVRVSDKGNVYFAQGNPDGSESAMKRIEIKNVATELEKIFAVNDQLLLLLKFDRKMKYNVMSDVFDEISRAKIEKRYAFIKMEDVDLQKIIEAGG